MLIVGQQNLGMLDSFYFVNPLSLSIAPVRFTQNNIKPSRYKSLKTHQTAYQSGALIHDYSSEQSSNPSSQKKNKNGLSLILSGIPTQTTSKYSGNSTFKNLQQVRKALYSFKNDFAINFSQIQNQQRQKLRPQAKRVYHYLTPPQPETLNTQKKVRTHQGLVASSTEKNIINIRKKMQSLKDYIQVRPMSLNCIRRTRPNTSNRRYTVERPKTCGQLQNDSYALISDNTETQKLRIEDYSPWELDQDDFLSQMSFLNVKQQKSYKIKFHKKKHQDMEQFKFKQSE